MKDDQIIPLSQTNLGDTVELTTLTIDGTIRRRLLDLGFVPGAIVKTVQKSPLKDPIAFRVSHTTIALRKDESDHIFGKIIERNDAL